MIPPEPVVSSSPATPEGGAPWLAEMARTMELQLRRYEGKWRIADVIEFVQEYAAPSPASPAGEDLLNDETRQRLRELRDDVEARFDVEALRPPSPATPAWWVGSDDGVISRGPFEGRQDAEDYAASWNGAYPDGPEFRAIPAPSPAGWAERDLKPAVDRMRDEFTPAEYQCGSCPTCENEVRTLRAELSRLRAGIQALADEWDADPMVMKWFPSALRALLNPTPKDKP